MFKIFFFSLLAFSHLVQAESEIKIIPAEKPNECLLIFAHGYRPEEFPNPATLDENGTAYRTLHKKGWILATTSYRRAGMVVEEGADDIDQLRDAIEKKYGPIRQCILHGESMGGTIVTLLAARDATRYQGAIAVGAALDLLPKGKTWTGPKIPLLFLTNQSELAGPQKYVEEFRATAKKLALWKVARDGHCNVNQAEVLAALLAIVHEENLTDREATVAPSPGPSKAIAVKGGIEVQIQEIDPVFGNFVVEAQLSDLAQLDIQRGDSFKIFVNNEIRQVLLGKEFNDVPEGEWVAFENADGWLRIAMNFRNAAKDLGIKKGDKLTIRPVK